MKPIKILSSDVQLPDVASASFNQKKIHRYITCQGDNMVLVPNGKDWVSYRDHCPHLLAPLHEGHINAQGHVVCGLHGWAFDPTTGQCLDIPHANKQTREAFAKNNIRLRTLEDNKSTRVLPATSAPQIADTVAWSARWVPVGIAKDFIEPIETVHILGEPFTVVGETNGALSVYNQQHTPIVCSIKDGLLSIWPDAHTCEQSLTTPGFVLPDAYNDGKYYVGNAQRDLDVSWQVVVANILDPSHIDYAHDGVTSKRENAGPINFVTKQKITKNGFSFTANEGRFRRVKYDAPYMVSSDVELPNGMKIYLNSFVVPLGAYKTRIIAYYAVEMPTKQIVDVFNLLNLRAVMHATDNKIIDGDIVMLHEQQETLKHYNMTFATKSDAPVANFWRWFDKYANNQVHYLTKQEQDKAALPPPPLSKAQLLSRKGHLEHCSDCSKTYKVLKQLGLEGILKEIFEGYKDYPRRS